ncbi:MAG: LytTR family transcriptional regulator [Sphingobacteriales bacterium]|nr:MAG: LytTR family transcriptional regulator [Sphingobacteriales bacterium]
MSISTVYGKLKQLHPVPTSRNVLVAALGIGLLISGVLFVFQPFGLFLVENGAAKNAIIAGYGLITFLVIVIKGIVVPAFIPAIYRKEVWTFGKDLFYDGLLSFLIIGTCNLLYSVWVFNYELSWRGFLFFQLATLLVGFLPYTVLAMYKHIRLLQRNIQTATSLNAGLETYQEDHTNAPADDLLLIKAESGYDKLELSPSAFAYAESADNYIKVFYEEQGVLREKMIRFTLKKLEDLFGNHPGIVRCHRAYIINVQFVASFSGNAQGLKLEVRNSEGMLVPVSRAMVPAIRGLLNSTG